ncbi:MAG: bifunctional sulfate adenylyltransferase/adenylylsulfate kinase [Gammaproteobacteria bacterium]|nr:bifunctional sulfate adenylyltransferase/adenylylsulfate kinase [Gammaproteobacteria bacterium]MCB1852406.1 bifunctional sulfate adenylyltransferase/adenylylsulfate kinase [Gammaproteobacteria bacterium]
MQERDSNNPDGVLLVDEARADALKRRSLGFKSVTLNKRQLCDLELLLCGGFSPLQSFLDQAAYESVLKTMRLPDGRLWPMPIVLDVDQKFAASLEPGDQIALRDAEGFMPAVLTFSESWQPDKAYEARMLFGTDSSDHPGVRYLYNETGGTYISGALGGIQMPHHHDFEILWNTPEEMRRLFEKMGWRRVVAFQTSSPMHRLHREMILSVAKAHEAHILLHPTVGVSKPGDLRYYARVHCYEAIRRHFPLNMAALSLLPLAMRMAGPREALWHALVNQNFGCTHFIMGPHHGSPPGLPGVENEQGKMELREFYQPYAAQQLARGYSKDLKIKVVEVDEWKYVPEKGRFLSLQERSAEDLVGVDFHNSDLKRALTQGGEIPQWFSYPSVLEELRKVYPPRSRQGFTLFFTGFSGSGKSTVARILYAKLIEGGGRPVSLLDGDVVRQHLSSELGFSKQDRDVNIRRIGFVASEITKNGGIAICAPIAPYRETRRAVREMIEDHGAFIEIHVSTPLEVCEARDRKGLYAKARKGLIPEFTGISDPYDIPQAPELRLDTSSLTPAQAVQEVLLYLFREGFIDEC